jgi:hypothetical protein
VCVFVCMCMCVYVCVWHEGAGRTKGMPLRILNRRIEQREWRASRHGRCIPWKIK